MAFTLSNASAFVIWGASNRERHGFEITVTPPEDEGPSRKLSLNDYVPASNTHFYVMHYFESGLNSSNEYTVEMVNPDVGEDNVLDLRYLQIVGPSAVPNS